MRLLSLLRSCITSPFNLRSAASPETGLPAPVAGLSFALTQGARPASGISLVTLPYIAAISWLWRCSLSPLGDERMWSTRSEYSAWLRRPGAGQQRAWLCYSGWVLRTNKELGCRLFIYHPALIAYSLLQGSIQRLKINSRRDDLAGFGRLLRSRDRDADGFCR